MALRNPADAGQVVSLTDFVQSLSEKTTTEEMERKSLIEVVCFRLERRCEEKRGDI